MTSTIIPSPAPQPARPEFVRMPKPGSVCPWTGLSRSYLYALAAEGKIKVVSLRKRGAARGVSLVALDTVFDFIHREAKQIGGAA